MSTPRNPKWPALLVVMRHAESEANRRREYLRESNSQETHLHPGQRDADVDLTDRGRDQAREVGRHLRGRYPPFDAVCYSPYVRTRETARLVESALARPPRRSLFEERLREKEWGIFEGLTKHGVRTLHAEEHRRRQEIGKYYHRPPGGESYPDVNLRVHSFLGTLVREHAGEHVLVVTHSVVVLAFRRLLERMSEEEVLDLDRRDEVKNASLLVYEHAAGDGSEGALRLAHYNLVPWDREAAVPAAP